MTNKKKVARILIFLLASALLILLDQWSKAFMHAKLTAEGPMTVIPKVLGFYYVENTGAAFNLLDQQRVLFLIIAAVAVIFCFYAVIKTTKDLKQERATSTLILHIFLCLILSGAVGNAIDRALNGYVVDFIRVLFINFPVFNIADCYVVVGCIFFLAFVIFRRQTLEEIEESLKRHG